jgi:hypothetical protein
MTRINMNIDAIRKLATTTKTSDCVAWGKTTSNPTVTSQLGGVALFAALLIICSLAVGCNSDQPKPLSSNQIPVAPTPIPAPVAAPAPVAEAGPKPTAKKAVRKRPANVTYADATNGVSFEYPRRYGLETGNAAGELVASSPLPMNFAQPGGVALAAVEVPMTGFANTDFSSAFFNVSVNKALTAENCGEFSVTEVGSKANDADKSATDKTVEKTAVASAGTPSASATNASETTTAAASTSNASSNPHQNQTQAPQSEASKLMIGKMELKGTETLVDDGNKKTEAKYFHAYQNGACYEFALNLTTITPDKDSETKAVDRKQVFDRLEKILATVKINAVENAADATPKTPPTAPAASATAANPTTAAQSPAQ